MSSWKTILQFNCDIEVNELTGFAILDKMFF